MRRTLLPAAAVLFALTACAQDEPEELRNDLAAVTEDDGAQVPEPGLGEGPEEQGPEEPVLEPVERPAELLDPEGTLVGGAWLREGGQGAEGEGAGERGTEVQVDVTGLTPGFHPVALYDVAACDTGDAAAGEAFASVGDLVAVLPPVLVLENGVGSLTALVEPAPALEELLADDGTALVVEETVPDPAAATGDQPAGSRVACAAFGPA